ncbi:nadh:flavin oxidoreductase nadh oxidase [Fusarium albosuccineum]|uniref:Nadh:flavin oxidoreductase nadh oxidase n=1 Tax=Fusarium albosuccineum TaxID=1237068 RepID=A0A8H4KYF4_9HYPO|nr:nadh:flavin oxidoreductase nadh oxidase [Fusarium albosuccineum]
MAASTRLFQPINLGRLDLRHRVVMAPLTRFRADENHVPLPNSFEYYTQRASTPGTLMITEATYASPKHCGGEHAPGIWSKEQIEGWKKITDTIHLKGSFIYLQLCAPGRAGAKDGYPLFSSSAVPMAEGAPTPLEMTESEIQECIEDFKAAATNAIAAGFDGVELHGANGYLIDQFSQDTCNIRTDSWGGSVENRARFLIETLKAVIEAIGSEHVAVRLSPWSTFQGMKMETAQALAQFSYIVKELKKLRLSYIHLIESRVVNNVDCEKKEGLEFAFDIWKNQSPILVAGGFNRDSAIKAVDEEYKGTDTLTVFGRYFVSTPDLVFRLRHGLKPNPYDRSTFYTPVQSEGYTDYSFSEEYLSSQDYVDAHRNLAN